MTKTSVKPRKTTNNAPDLARLVTLGEAAKMAGIPKSTAIYAYRRGEILAYLTAGKVVLVYPETIQDWAKQPRKRGPKPGSHKN